ncbi:hypothetical protein SLS56_001186 [Neofusicoccum ribis]|uniref:Uncharacterized protein n=1 Tax=Neofusicoccum ribis TaxID=45134 RepID=A0ABR3TB76_9PEZI
MSGVEVAGLVLGTLPLLIEAIKAYADGVSTVERYLKYEVPLRNLHRALGAEYVIYQNTCEELLNGLVENNDERTALLEQPGGPGWRKPALERKLNQRLSRAYTAYVETMEDMEFAVSEIKKLLKLGSDGKVQLKASNKFRKEYHRLKFSLKKSEYDELLSQIQQRNARLRTLTQQTLTLEPSRLKRQLPDFDLIRDYAASVYKNICASLKSQNYQLHTVRHGQWRQLMYGLYRKSLLSQANNKFLPPARNQ